jgi:predicted AAA+ superfamily ATPase
VGRARELVLYPLSFGDVARDRVGGLMTTSDDLPQLQRLYGADLARLFDDCAVWGTYPSVTTEPSLAKRHDELLQIYQSYVLRDVSQYLRLQNTGVFNDLVTLLASMVGSQAQWETLARTVKSSSPTIREYVDILEDTFVCKRILPFTGNVVGSIRKMPKIYFVDSGLRNSALADHGDLRSRPDRGHLVEQVVFQELCKLLAPTDRLYYWRTYAGAHEVDFVIARRTSLLPIKVKDSSFRSPAIPEGMLEFSGQVMPRGGIVLNRDYVGAAKTGSTDIRFLPMALALARPDILGGILADALR